MSVPHSRRALGLAAAVLALGTLTACGSDQDKVEDAVEKVTGDSDVELKGNSPADAAGYALVSVMSAKFTDYEIDGSTVRLIAKKGVELSGSECVIIDSATSADHPDLTFVITGAGEDVTC